MIDRHDSLAIAHLHQEADRTSSVAGLSDYDHLAVRLAEPHLGSIVHGYAPGWEKPSRIAGSFEEFLARFTQEAASPEPAYPYGLFL